MQIKKLYNRSHLNKNPRLNKYRSRFIKIAFYFIGISLFLTLTIPIYNQSKKNKQKLAWPVNTRAGDRGPTISADGKILIFESERDALQGSYDLYESTWSNGRWSRPRNLKVINSLYYDGHASISADGQLLYFSSNRATKDSKDDDLDIWVSRRNLQGVWQEPESVEVLNTDKHDSNATLSFDQSEIYFCSERSGGQGEKDIWKAERKGKTWVKLQPLPYPINTSEDDCNPQISAASDQLYFASNRSKGYGEFDIYRIYRKSMESKWSKPENIGSFINTNGSEKFFTLPAKGTSIYVAKGPIDQEDIYEYQLPEKYYPTRIVVLQGKVLDFQDSNPLENAKIRFTSLTKKSVGKIGFNPPKAFEVYSIANTGQFTVNLYAEQKYQIKLNYQDYQPFLDTVSYLKIKNTVFRRKDIVLSNRPIIKNFAGVYFLPGKAYLSDESKISLRLYLEYLQKDKTKKIILSGYADYRGSSKLKKSIGLKRAEAVKKYLVNLGIAEDRFELVFGGSRGRPGDSVKKLHYYRTVQIALGN
jgi:OOP family OmpA-OmpF porin